MHVRSPWQISRTRETCASAFCVAECVSEGPLVACDTHGGRREGRIALSMCMRKVRGGAGEAMMTKLQCVLNMAT
jgi:hypothetical protein